MGRPTKHPKHPINAQFRVLGTNQTEVAKLMGCKQQRISRLINKPTTTINIVWFNRLCDLLDIDTWKTLQKIYNYYGGE
jgi:plasmid maintenance system antidote protein VapI